MIEQIVQSFLIIATIGLIMAVLYHLIKFLGGLFIIGLIGGLVFMEVYGIYLFFTERNLYVEDFSANGFLSFTGIFVLCNFFIFSLILMKGVRRIKG